MGQRTMTTMDENELVRRLRRGDRATFEGAIQTHYESVWRQHLLLCGNRDVAADLTQETFVEAWRFVRSFRGESSLRTWLHTIAVRVWQRSLSAKRTEAASPEMLDTLPDRTPTPDKAITQTLLNESVTCALRKLPEHQRVVIVLCYRQEMTHTEAAQALEIPVGTVKSRLHDGLRHLRRLLGSHQEELS